MNTEIKYFPGNKNHLTGILAVELDSFEYPYETKDFEAAIKAQRMIVAVDKKVIGYILYDDSIDKFTYIHSVAVDRRYRRKGIGSKLVGFVTDLCSDFKAPVRESNLVAQQFFRSLRFTVFETEKNYFSEGCNEDAYMFTLYAGIKQDVE